MMTPAQIMDRLEELEADMATREATMEDAAEKWYRAKRDREHKRAEAFITATGTVAERNARADAATALLGVEDEALYEAMKAVLRTMETRAAIGMALLKSHGRAGS